MIDILKASKQLIKDGFGESQAQSLVSIIASRDEQLATKSDIDGMDQRLSSEINGVDQRLSSEINGVHQRLSSMDKRISLLQWMIGLCLAGIIALLILLVQIA